MKEEKSRKKSPKIVWVVIIVLVVIAIGLGIFFFRDNISSFAKGANQRSAVFLTNGQVYFGYMDGENSQYVSLKNIYYIKSSDTSADSNKLTLVKLGSEVYGPEDSMKINRDHILYFESMKDHSKIADSIAKAGK